MSTAYGSPTRGTTASPRRESPTGPGRAPLRVVAPRATAASSVPFVAVLAVLLVAGLVGLLLLNTAMQRRAFSLTTLAERADALDVQAAALTMRTDRLASPSRLMRRAAELGMVPNTTPVFLDLSTGRVVGTPVAASSASSVPGLLPEPPPVAEPERRAPEEEPKPEVADAPTSAAKPPGAGGGTEDGPGRPERGGHQ